MLSQFKTRRPPKNFNLLYLQNNQIHFMSLKVTLLIQPTHQQYLIQLQKLFQSYRIQGKLHLCSRSIFFQPKNIAKPLLRIKFSCGVILRMLKNIQTKKVYKLITIKKNQIEVKVIVFFISIMCRICSSKDLGLLQYHIYPIKFNNLQEILEQQEQKKHKTNQKNQLFIQKLYEPIKRTKPQSQDKQKQKQKQKISNCFFIRVPKIFIIYRKPISPYITEKSQQNYLFQVNKSNPKNKVLRFLKLFDEIMKCTDQDKLIKSIITATCQQSAQQILQTYQQQKLQASHILKCRRINIQGPQHGQFVLLKNKIKFYPLINSPDYQTIQFTYRQIKFITRYRYLFQDIGIQIWVYNYPFSLLFVFSQQSTRQMVYRVLKQKGQKILKIQLSDIINMWSNGQITNIQYLNFINIIANRSHNDLSQYPIFPWILHNYDKFEIKNNEMYRDLTKPIGAINKHRLRKLKDYYQMQSKDKTTNNQPHLYSTHYSMPGYVSYYLIRKIPEFIVRLQNGVFSPSDRIFRQVESAYYSSMNSNADFKQLIPEFYSTQCDFLVNSEKLEMGSTPQGELIDDVILPKWASNAEDFLLKMRAAFESDYVSATLSQWIDLIFGYKQNGTSAITFDNIFYHLTYQQNVVFDKNMSKMQKVALQVQISQFGQTPLQIFQQKHITKKARIINLQITNTTSNNQDKKLLNAKLLALGQQNQRLQQQIQRQRYRFNKKLSQKQQLLLHNQKQKKKQVQKIRQKLSIDSQTLKNFQFKQKFISEDDKNKYIRQIEELLKQNQRKNNQMNVIIAGMKRESKGDGEESICSNIEENVKLEEDFFVD